MSIQMENTAEELTGFELSILDYVRKLLMLARCGETEEPAAPLDKPVPQTTHRRKLFLPREDMSFDQHGSL